ncbi:hypothetical protein [Streptomyces sp. VRA16 Mangrove soil]|uniref:hypothetical protein n=1 Tax=Streptomyces sp. VRA16 Mangrove soil TaxID=2817434 RepID=UPI0027DBC7A5|nr:hypothetical protein [Streptomyces sp. VRA16 Mangrove soil]
MLTLLSPHGVPYFYAPEASAIWIVLRQSGGDLACAAAELGDAWGADVSYVRRMMEQHVADWRRAGLVQTSAAPGPRRASDTPGSY